MLHMSMRRRVCCLPLRLNASKNHIWISEDVLDNAMHRFAHGKIPRRHVGLAPGPLEARKRATKRRMMNLAQVGGGGGFDPSVLSGLGAPERVKWKWQSPTPLIPQRPEEPAPLPSWFTDPPSIEADEHLENLEKAEDVDGVEQEEGLEQQHAEFRRKGLLANSDLSEDFKKCSDLVGLHSWAADYGIDIRMYPKLLFPRLCHAGQPLPALLYALEDVALGTPGNLNFLLDWQLRKRKGEGRLRKRLNFDDMVLLQQWMRRQLCLGMKTEEDILVFLRFVSRVNDATSDESLRCTFIASIFEGLQSSSVFGLEDLGTETQCKLLESITQVPVTRQSLDLGFSLVEAIRQAQLEGTDEKISAFIGGVVHAHASLREHEKRETQFLETIPRALEMIRGLPQGLACSVILITTKALINEHFRMSVSKAATMQLPDTWWSALATTGVLDSGRQMPLKTKIERFLSFQKPEVVVPYLQQLNDRNKARFMLRYWLGPKTRSGRIRARYLFDGFCSAKGNDSPWVSMFQAARDCAQEFSKPSDDQINRVFKVLQMLRQSENIVEIIKQARKLHTIIDESHVVYTIKEHLGERPHLAERLFSFYPRLRLEKCPELAERMILNPRSHPETALRYMRSRRSRFAVDREGFSQLRTQLLERMALAYSTAQHITPRMAFRNAHQCYTQRRKERLGPPSVAMARALARAGLLRPLQAGKWVSTTAIRWILSLVRCSESADVADQIDEKLYKWRGLNARKIRAASLANRRARPYAAIFPTDFRVRTKWSKYYRGYEKIYTSLNIPRHYAKSVYKGFRGRGRKVSVLKVPVPKASLSDALSALKIIQQHEEQHEAGDAGLTKVIQKLEKGLQPPSRQKPL